MGELARVGTCWQGLLTVRWLREIRADAHVHIPKCGMRKREYRQQLDFKCYGRLLYVSVRKTEKKFET